MKISPLSQFTVQRLSLISDKPFASVLAAIRDGIGHPDMTKFWAEIWTADSFQKVESIVKPALGPTGLMEFAEFDDGAFIRKDRGEITPLVTGAYAAASGTSSVICSRPQKREQASPDRWHHKIRRTRSGRHDERN